MSLNIRNSLERDDWKFVREACALTGNAGDPIDESRWDFFGEQWIAPYERLRPGWTYVAEGVADQGTERLGYLTGSPDTETFIREKFILSDGPLYLRCLLGRFTANKDVTAFRNRFRAELAGPPSERGPRDQFPAEATRSITEHYPAHLHINLVSAARGRGVGSMLIERFREDLSRIGIRGIHLTCAEQPLKFYERNGFRILDKIEFRPGFMVYRLGSRF